MKNLGCLFLMLLITISCDRENLVDNSNLEVPLPETNTIRLQLPSSLIAMPISRAVATQEENAVSRLDIYVFDSNGMLVQIVADATILNQNYVDITANSAELLSFYLVANPQGASMLNNATVGQTMLSDFSKMTTDATAMPVSLPLMMTGYIERINPNITRIVSVPMTRRTSKLKINNDPARTGITIKQVMLPMVTTSVNMFDTEALTPDAQTQTITLDYNADQPIWYVQATGSTQITLVVEQAGMSNNYLIRYKSCTLKPNLYLPINVADYGASWYTKTISLAGIGATDYRFSIPTTWSAADYSGITWIGDNRYAVVTDKNDGFYIMEINTTSSGATVISRSPFYGSQSTSRDCEGIIYHPQRGTLFIAGEADQRILEYDMQGNKTGVELAIPAMFAKSKIASNYGFESLAYDHTTGLFWTTTESTLPSDGGPANSTRKYNLHRIQSFSEENLQPIAQYVYRSDEATVDRATAQYAFGIPEITALPDGRLLVMEREFTVYDGLMVAFSYVNINIYLTDPKGAQDVTNIADISGSSYLPKTLLANIRTPLSGIANYEGLCLGPVLEDGSRSLLMINDSQSRYSNMLSEYLKMMKIYYN